MFKCDNCGSSDTYVKNYKHEYNIKGEKVIFEKERRFCRKCNKLVFDAYLDNEASKESIKKYNNIIGICAEDIIKLSKKYSGRELEYKIKQKMYQKGFTNFYYDE